jgi:hypothetical protein
MSIDNDCRKSFLESLLPRSPLDGPLPEMEIAYFQRALVCFESKNLSFDLGEKQQKCVSTCFFGGQPDRKGQWLVSGCHMGL